MKVLMPQAAIVIALERGEALSLQDAQGFRIVPERGTVWVTQERFDADDIVGPGDRLTLGMPGRTVVEALSAAVVRIAKDNVGSKDGGCRSHSPFRIRSPSPPSASTR